MHINFFRVNSLPVILVPSSIYLVANDAITTVADIYVVGTDVSNVRRIAAESTTQQSVQADNLLPELNLFGACNG